MSSNLFLNFESILTDSKPDNIYSVSLTEQFNNLKTFTYEDTAEDFFRRAFLMSETKTVHFSSPSLDKEASIIDDKHGNRYYKNIAIRTLYNSEKSLDLVLMGDINEPSKADTNRYQFIVKGFTLMDSGIRHFGELTETCRIIVSLSKGERYRKWEDYNSEINPTFDWDQNLFTRDFINKLLTQYVVENPKEVKETIQKWKSYLEAKLYKIEIDSNNGYDADVIEVIVAERDTNRLDKESDSVPFLKNWYASGNGEKKVLIHAAFDYKEDDINSDSKIKKNLDEFLRKSLKIVDPKTDQNKKNTGKNEEAVTLKDAHISAGQKEQILPTNSLSELLDELNKDKATAKDRNKLEFEKEISSKLEIYKNGPLNTELDVYVESQKEDVSEAANSEIEERIKAERNIILESITKLENKSSKISAEIENLKKIDGDEGNKSQISKLSKELKEFEEEIFAKKESLDESKISEKYDVDKIITAKLESLRNEKTRSALNKAENIYRNDLKPTYDKNLEEVIETLEQRYDADYNSILKNETICRIHYYFSMDVPETSRADEFQNTISSRISKHNLIRFKYDDMGDRVLLGRQSKALSNFTEGYLMNPYLATFLFNPSADDMNLGEIDSFYIENLNESQKEAIVRSVTSNGMFLIQGPPGTGKTQVIAEITAQMIERKKKVMIASENHKAIDNAFDRIPKIPQIRPVRFLSDERSKDHPYSQDALLDNFYTNIIVNLKKRIDRFENYEAYRNTFREKYDKIKVLFSKVQKGESKISKIKDRKVKLETEYGELQKKSMEDIEEDRVLRTEITNCKNAIREIEFFEYNDENFIKNLQEKLKGCGVEIPEGEDAAHVASRIVGLSMKDIVDQIIFIGSHEQYIDLLDRKSKEESRSKIPDLNKMIREYEEKNSMKAGDMFLFNYFGANVSSAKVQEVQDILKDFKNNEIKLFEFRIKEYESVKRVNPELNKTKLKNLELDIKDLESDSAYTQYRESLTQFKAELKNMMQDLEIQASYDSAEDALELIESKWHLIQRNQKENADRSKILVPIYKEIIKYISNESLLKSDKERYTDRLTELVNVIGMTCTSKDRMGDLNIKTMGADVVIIDEVSKIPFIEILQPLLYGKTAILVGDHKQLPPMYSRIFEKDANPDLYDPDIINEKSDRIFREMYEKSFFEELFIRSPKSYKSSLSKQYRMHPDIMGVVNFFYSSNPLDFGGNLIDKDHYLNIIGANGRTILDENTHILFIDCKGRHTQESGSTSFSNKSEIDVVSELIHLLDSNCKYDRNRKPLKANKKKFEDDERLSLGVITAYKDQARQIRKNRLTLSSFNQNYDEKYTVSTVDDFQGDERDIIILSTVRTSGNTPFLEDFRRINVAMSRARRLLIIVGNGAYLQNMRIKIDGKTEKTYNKIIERIRSMGGYREDLDILGGGY